MTAPLDRSDPAFFHDARTKELIEDIACLNDLVVFAGSGVTVDQTGVDWRTLILSVRNEADSHPPGVCEQMLDLYGERRTASALAEEFRGEHGETEGRAILEGALHKTLYSGGGWAEGRLAQSVGRLAATWAATDGRSVSVATTNYEDYLERALLDACRAERPIEVRVLPDGTGPLQLTADAVNLVYLHGYLPRHAGEDESARIQRLGHPVFSEADYLGNEAQCAEYLTQLFSDRSLLIVGCGLTDEPLLKALLATKPAGRYERNRFVLLPLQSREWTYSSRDELDALKALVDLRLRHLGVVPIFPDFFSQTSQFLQEVSLSARAGKGRYKRADSTITYGRRLTAWWNAWSDGRQVTSDPLPMQKHDHDQLKASLNTIRDALGAPESEPLKIEVWLRWEPSDSSRRLLLWASTVGLYDDLLTMRTDEITTQSEYVSLGVFCDGRARRIPDRSHDEDPKGRWGVYLASPIWLSDEKDQTEIPVGVVTLASMLPLAMSSLRDNKRDRFKLILPLLQDVGKRVANPKLAGASAETDSG